MVTTQKAAEQVDLAEDQLEGMTESPEDDEHEEIEEGVGEDADEPGDIDTNDVRRHTIAPV